MLLIFIGLTTIRKLNNFLKRAISLILFYTYSRTCGACEFMEEMVFSDKLMYPYVNENMIPVAIDIDNNNVPKELLTEVTPTFQFIRKDGSALREILIGGKTGNHFLNLQKKQ